MSTGELFKQAVAVEETDPKTALRLYEQVIASDGSHAAALINAGTIFYKNHRFTQAEAYYRRAIKIDPKYALAYFDLAIVLEETGRTQDAIAMYQLAIKFRPPYADAHYNLALAYERCRNPRKALAHWRIYVKCDAGTPWAKHAREKIGMILRKDRLKVVWRNLAPTRTKGHAGLTLCKSKI